MGITIYSCKKDRSSGTANTTDAYDISEYQSAYNLSMSGPKSFAGHPGGGSTGSSLSLIHGAQVDWNTNYIYKRTDGSIVAEFKITNDSAKVKYKPIDAPDTAIIVNKTDVVFIKQKDGSNLSFYIKVSEDVTASGGKPTSADLHYGVLPKGFTGMIY